MSENRDDAPRPGSEESRRRLTFGAAAAIGIGAGVAFGVSADNMAAGVGVGLGIGALLFGASEWAAARGRRRGNRRDDEG